MTHNYPDLAGPSGGTERTESLAGPGATAGVERTEGLLSASRSTSTPTSATNLGTDGYLAGNVTALSGAGSPTSAGTAIGTLGSVEGTLGTGYSAFSTGAETEAGRTTSRHARPEPDEFGREQSLGDSDPLGISRASSSAGPAMPASSAEAYYSPGTGQGLGEQSYAEPRRSGTQGTGAYHAQPSSIDPLSTGLPLAEYEQNQGTRHPGAQGPETQGQGTAQPLDSEASALGSLDSSGLFGSLSSPPR